ncbi:MAG TPA: hypothetical protein VEW46_20420 [Pyrinomonadaceae bacterium]|nr:hypothetical protein [Pyrinomonadaceae bacterium]
MSLAEHLIHRGFSPVINLKVSEPEPFPNGFDLRPRETVKAIRLTFSDYPDAMAH